MTDQNIYIKAATHISLQQPLSEAWMTTPEMPDAPYQRSKDPNFREWLNPLESRRMGKLMKRALVTAMKVMKETDISQPEAIITGTGLGCIENTELFLDQLCREGEEMLKPTYFMQSTHNTISSLIAIQGKCHGYNTTYSHKSVSFDSALFDAFVQMRIGDVRTALVTGNDEMTPSYFSILQRTGYVGQAGQVTASEASAAMMLTTEKDGALCEIEEARLLYHSGGLGDTSFGITTCSEPIDAVMLGVNGNPANDAFYEKVRPQFAGVPALHYKHLFGECYTASALGVYAAAHLLKQGEVPAFIRYDGVPEPLKVNRMLFVNHSDGQNISYIVLKKVE